MPIATRFLSPPALTLASPTAAARSNHPSTEDAPSFGETLFNAQYPHTTSSSDAASRNADKPLDSKPASSQKKDDSRTKSSDAGGNASEDTSGSSQGTDSSAAASAGDSAVAKKEDSDASSKSKDPKAKADDTATAASPDAATIQAAAAIAAQTAPVAPPAEAAKPTPADSTTTPSPTAGTDTSAAKAPAAPKPPSGKQAKAAGETLPAEAQAASAAADKKAVAADAAPAPEGPATSAKPAAALAQAKSKQAEAESASSSAPSASAPAADPAPAAPSVTALQTAEVAATLAKAANTPDTTPHTDNSVSAASATPTMQVGPRLATTDRATTASAAQESPASEGAQTFDQIVLGLRGKIDARNGKAEIRLDPPNLGTVRVSVSLDKGTLTAQFSSSSDSVRDLLKGNMDKLKNVLESQGVSVDRLSVEPPAAKTATTSDTSSAQAGANDGRSAGQYQQNASDQRRSSKEASVFSRVWREATQDAAPMDVTA